MTYEPEVRVLLLPELSQATKQREVSHEGNFASANELSPAGTTGSGANYHVSVLNRLGLSGKSSVQPFVQQLQRQYGNRYVQRVIHLARQDGEAEVHPDVESTINRTRGGGQPLEHGIRNQMNAAFDSDFSAVRVHTGAEADSLNHELNAHAFTTGRDIYFGQGKYNPGNSSGKELLAHELTHVVQQSGGTIQGKLEVGPPGDQYEEEADRVAKTVSGLLESSGRASTDAPVASTQQARVQRQRVGTLQRAVSTLGGDWETNPKYEVVNDGTQDIGVEIDRLHFKPKNPADATKIGLTQRVISIQNGSALALNPAVASRSIPSGEPDAGSHIDRLSGRTNPIYGMDDPTDAGKTLGGSTTAGNSQWGFHYKGAGGAEQHQDATLYDKPALPGHGANSSQLFETTALAVEGSHAGTSYGSVRWGWQSDASNALKKEPLSVVAYGVPTAAFKRSADLWNATPGAVQLPAMKAAQPTAGTEAAEVEKSLQVKDYATAYQILNGQWMRPMLPTLSQLNKKGLLPDLYSNTDKAVGVSTPRLRVAMEAVQFKENKVPLSQEFNDWIDPTKNPLTSDINEIKGFLGMKDNHPATP